PEHHGEKGDELARIDALVRESDADARRAGSRDGKGSRTHRVLVCWAIAALRAGGCATDPVAALCDLVFTLTTTDMPGRRTCCRATSVGMRMRTGSRWTILVKLPVALSGGSSENTEPEAGDMLSMVPRTVLPGSASMLISTDCPGRRCASWVSLKF